tara:strand:- start:34 stop:333 length:300 start_codon:yes stop_codon:yes gene_type:complete
MSTPFKMKGFSGFGEGTGSPLRLFGGVKSLISKVFNRGGDDAPAMQEGGGDNLGTVPTHGPEAHTGGDRRVISAPGRAEEMMSSAHGLGGATKWMQGGM